MGKGRDSVSDGVSMASRSMSSPVTSSSSSGERERKVEGKSSEIDSLPPEDQHQLFPWQRKNHACSPKKHPSRDFDPETEVMCTHRNGRGLSAHDAELYYLKTG